MRRKFVLLLHLVRRVFVEQLFARVVELIQVYRRLGFLLSRCGGTRTLSEGRRRHKYQQPKKPKKQARESVAVDFHERNEAEKRAEPCSGGGERGRAHRTST